MYLPLFQRMGEVTCRMTIVQQNVMPHAALAPMAGVADTAFRTLCCEMGAVMCTSEMISAKGLCYNSKGSAELCRITEAERPMGLQLFGNEPDFIAKAVTMLQEYAPDWIDLNMGCPVPKVVNTGAGSALLKTPELAAECVRAAVRASSVPVTVKMRIGWGNGENCAVSFAQAMEDAGAAAVTVHGRTKSQLYAGHADWDAIRQVREAVQIPVIGNGDVQNADDCEHMYRETGAALVMVGRAAYGNPWIFREIACLREGVSYSPPTAEERMEMMLRHIRMIVDNSAKPPALAIREARKHASWYMAGCRYAASFRNRCFQLTSYEEAQRLAEDYLVMQSRTET